MDVQVSFLDVDNTESPGYRDFVWAVELHRLGLGMIGLWPKIEKFKSNLWPEIQVGIILILLIFISIPMICAVMRVWGDMVLLIDSLQITIPLLTVSVKYVIMRWKQTVLLSIVHMMAEDWMASKLDGERDVMIKRAQTARFIMIIGYVLAITGFLTVTIPPYFGIQILYATNHTNRTKLLPLETFHFYDTNKSPQYELTFFIHMITTLLAAVIYMSVDIFLMLIILHICGQLENFKCRLVSLVSCKNFNKILRNIIATHLRLMRFAEKIENIYSLMMLIMVLYFGIVFCLGGFIFTIFLTSKKGDDAVVTKVYYSTVLLIALLMNTFLYCGAGELVTERVSSAMYICVQQLQTARIMLSLVAKLHVLIHVFVKCNAVYRALCDLEWYKLESREARNLIMLMIRSYQPFRITAGKIIPLTMATFCNILKTSSGYISFLLTKRG